MKLFIGTKVVKATPMNRLAYNQLRGWPLPADENGDDEGYLVEYIDGGKPNLAGYEGYVSWSPKEQFDNAYIDTSKGMSFGQAIEALKRNQLVARAGWNGKSMFLYLVKGSDLQKGLRYGFGEYLGEPEIVSSIAMKTAQNTVVIGWLASQTDMLANDWVCVGANNV
jgi:hypothetical protein